MRFHHFLCLFLAFSFISVAGQSPRGMKDNRSERQAVKRLSRWQSPVTDWDFPSSLTIDSVRFDKGAGVVDIYFPEEVSYNPVRESHCSLLTGSVMQLLGKRFAAYRVSFHAGRSRLEELIPNYFRVTPESEPARMVSSEGGRPDWVVRQEAVKPVRGLQQRYIALWHSHGYYFDMPLDRWEWQRAKLFGSVEDLSVMAYVIPYLVPMLENSGATVMLPRERDIQVHEVIVDNDRSTGLSYLLLDSAGVAAAAGPGFLPSDTLFSGDNPFLMGTSLSFSGGEAQFVPQIPVKGDYGVTIAYPRIPGHNGKVSVRVMHTGGETSFIVDQSLGGGTWLWLGAFWFDAGIDATRGSVIIEGLDGAPALLDAVRFGGGMGSVARRPAGALLSNQRSLDAGSGERAEEAAAASGEHSWKLSGKPRFLEGARYWLQYAGMPDTLVYTPTRGTNDYNDDYMSRAEWVNYLLRQPDSSVLSGPGLPVDLSLAFHTDAGITPDDSVIGTLGIYSTLSDNGWFPDGRSRLASRDLTDIVQTQITEDIKAAVNPEWTRRAMWDRSYYEARRPDVPAMLLELLSHQNLADQRHGFDPRFRFLVSRAVYKGILRYLATASGSDYVVHPLPVSHFAVEPLDDKQVKLSWQAVADPLESTALPHSYRVYMRRGDDGFDNGVTVNGTSYIMELPSYHEVYSFRVTALNDGGESFPSEELSAGVIPQSGKPVLIVNGFDRVSGPAWFDRDGMAGVAWWDDRGVADRYSFISTGDQYDFERSSPWTDDDDAGWGASYSEDEGRVIPGNSFDFTGIHGRSLLAAGRSFFSVSDEVFTAEDFDLSRWCMADLLFGEEKTTPSPSGKGATDFSIYTPELLHALERAERASLPLLMTGAYVGSDLAMAADTAAVTMVKRVLHFSHRTNHAVRTGGVAAVDAASSWFSGVLEFNAGVTDDLYAAEAPDAIEPAGGNAITAFRYTENNTSAAVIYTGRPRSLVMGFPFETIISDEHRDRLMLQIVDFLLNKGDE